MTNLTTSALAVAVAVEVAVIAGIVVSIVSPDHRVWPPERVSWRFWYYWGGSLIAFVALTVVAVFDAGTFVFGGVVWDATGGVLIGTGLAFAGWAGVTFRLHESFGLEGKLHTGGPYRYSRNPQYVGMGAALVGVVLVANSLLLTVGMSPVFIWILLLPLAEEPWLREEFGEEYEEYYRNVPRFVGVRSIRRLLESGSWKGSDN